MSGAVGAGDPGGASPSPRARRWARRLLPLLVLLGCVAIGAALLATGPVATRQPRPPTARIVEVTQAERTTAPARLDLMGTVVATREVVLRPQVSGRVVEVAPDFVPGGRFATGDVMLRIDPSDALLAIRQREAELAQTRAELRLERGNQAVARSEFALLGEAIAEADRDLVLRQPQLASVEARVEAAEAALDRARLDLERTTLRAPFPALVRSRGVELGSRVDAATEIATIVDTGAYWIEVLVPAGQLRWIDVPRSAGTEGALDLAEGALDLAEGSRAVLRHAGAWGPGAEREGRIVRLLGDIESEGRMARLLVRVDDPLALAPEHRGLPPLLLGSYVSVEIRGRPLEDVFSLDRSFLRGGDRVWLLGDDGRLEIRPVEVAFRGADHVLVQTGLASGDRIVTSALSSPVAGMLLRAAPEAPPVQGVQETVQATADASRDVSEASDGG